MKRIAVRSRVSAGYYWSMGRWEIANVGPEGGVLEGSDGDTFVKLPFVLLLVVAPVMGLAYVVFLPFIGFALVLGAVARRVARALTRGAVDLSGVVEPPLATGEAYLTGERPTDARARGEPKNAPAKDAALDAVAEEIAGRREQR